jgi:hypothetical protein
MICVGWRDTVAVLPRQLKNSASAVLGFDFELRQPFTRRGCRLSRVARLPCEESHDLVTRDKDLLDLMNDHAFRQRFPALTILDPVAFLKAIASREEQTGSTPQLG